MQYVYLIFKDAWATGMLAEACLIVESLLLFLLRLGVIKVNLHRHSLAHNPESFWLMLEYQKNNKAIEY